MTLADPSPTELRNLAQTPAVAAALAARPRRLRRTAGLRRMVAETALSPADLCRPLFVVHGAGVRRPIAAMPGEHHFSVDQLAAEAEITVALGIPAVLLFGLPASKDALGSENLDPDGIVPRAVRALKAAAPELVVITDVCCCEYTDHGHCGVLAGDDVLNDPTLDLLGRAAVAHAEAGADIVAPSGMMDGMVAAIRTALDASGHADTAILSYAAKFASAFYGPFREAADSAPALGDRRGYQMDPANAREAAREIALDVAQGADMVMVKPALAYLDVLSAARRSVDVPLAAYNVSGEYAMIKAAAERGWLDERAAVLESLTAIKRAGADLIITYWALEAACWLREDGRA